MKTISLLVGLVLLSSLNAYYIRMIYQSYTPVAGTVTDYHSISLEYGDASIDTNDPTDKFFVKAQDTTAIGSQTKFPADKTNILYTKEAYMPGLPIEKFTYKRTYPDNSTIQKYYVMYDIAYVCENLVPKYTMKIKYFYCFASARAFFENTDEPNGGSGTGLKLIHNGVDLEATLSKITVKVASVDTEFNLKGALNGAATACTTS